jgi:hypothetical protein
VFEARGRVGLGEQALRGVVVDAAPVGPEGLVVGEAEETEALRWGERGAPRSRRVAQQDVEAFARTERAGELCPARLRVGAEAASRALARVEGAQPEHGRAVKRRAIL